MRLLAIEATTKSASCALVDKGHMVAHSSLNTGLTHSETLLPLIDQVLTLGHLKVADLDGIVVANGPGSFTGLRIALSTAKALAHPFNLPLYAVSTLRGLAYHGKGQGKPVVAILDARRQQVYAEAYNAQGEVILPESTYKLDGLAGLLPQEEVIFVGDGVPVHQNALAGLLGSRANFLGPDSYCGSAMGLLDAHNQGLSLTYGYQDLPANYLRLSQAERELKEKKHGD